jgi:mono/diheme cytochrome c family protein
MGRAMTKSKRMLAAVGVVGLLATAAAQTTTSPAAKTSNRKNQAATGDSASGRVDQIRRGEYLVNSVAMCVQCHTPRNERGDMIRLQLLRGANMPVRSPWPDDEWAARTPSLAGLPGGWSEQDVIKLLMTGQDPTGRSPQPPMPPFRMNREDAAAVAAYLRSLPPGNGVQDSGR